MPRSCSSIAERSLKPEQPENASTTHSTPGRAIGGGDDRFVPGEVEDAERQHGEDERRQERRARAKLDRQVLARDEPRGGERYRVAASSCGCRHRPRGRGDLADDHCAVRGAIRALRRARRSRLRATSFPSSMIAACDAIGEPLVDVVRDEHERRAGVRGARAACR